jgi:pyruvate kinase
LSLMMGIFRIISFFLRQGIVEVSDALLICREALGFEMELDKIPVIQSQIIEMCHMFGKPVIVSSQILSSMSHSSRPTCAEVRFAIEFWTAIISNLS